MNNFNVFPKSKIKTVNTLKSLSTDMIIFNNLSNNIICSAR